MTTTETESSEVVGYLAAIRDALADLPDAERDDLLEDLEAHLYEVLAESGTTLAASLGSPLEYAVELRATAGLAPAPKEALPLLRRLERSIARSSVWPALVRLSARPAVRTAREFVPTLRPGWWLVRGWLWLFAAVVWLHNGELDPYRRRIVVPTYHDNWAIGVVALVVALVASVWLGLRQLRLPRSVRRVIGAVSAVVVLLALSDYGDAESIASGGGYYGGFNSVSAATVMATPAPYPGITIDGRRPLNIFPYDRQGHLLSGVRLFDDRGVPLQGLGKSDPVGILVRVLPSDVAGGVVSNEYPQQVGTIPRADLGNGVVPTAGPSAYARSTPMPTPTIFVAPMAGGTTIASPAPTPAPTQSTGPVLTSAPPSPAPTSHSAKARAPVRSKPDPTRTR